MIQKIMLLVIAIGVGLLYVKAMFWLNTAYYHIYKRAARFICKHIALSEESRRGIWWALDIVLLLQKARVVATAVIMIGTLAVTLNLVNYPFQDVEVNLSERTKSILSYADIKFYPFKISLTEGETNSVFGKLEIIVYDQNNQ